MPQPGEATCAAPITARPLLRLVLVGLGISVAPLDTAVNIAFPNITGSFGLPVAAIQWVVICYVLANAGPLLAFGRVGDLWGHGRVFRAGLAWTTAAFLLCAAAPSFAWLLVFRVMQGIGAALVVSCAPAIVTSLYPEARRSRALGVFTLMFAIGSAIGPLIGGALVARWGWPAVFWFRAPIALISLVFLRGLPAIPGNEEGHRHFDVAGAALLAFGLACLLLGVNAAPRLGSGDLLAAAMFPAAAASFAAFVWWEGRAPQPMVRIALFRRAGFSVVILSGCLIYLVTFSVMLIAPYFLVRYTGLSLPLAGTVLASGYIGMAATSPVAGALVGRLSAERVAPLGAFAGGAGLFLAGFWQPHTAPAAMVLTLLLQGTGLALFQVAYMELVMAASPTADRGVAGSLAMLTRTVGVVMGAALLTLGFQMIETAGQGAGLGGEAAFLAAFHGIFRLCGAAAVLSGVLISVVLRRRVL